MKKKDFVVGIIGGMGSYATADLFIRLLNAIPAEREWDRPRILVDNYCTMPSRVRAILYNEKREELVADLRESVDIMLKAGVKRIILACNTSHVFLDEVLNNNQSRKDIFINIIDKCANNVKESGFDTVGLIASEGTIETSIYNNYFSQYGIKVHVPSTDQYEQLRFFIEAVKQNSIDEQVIKMFGEYIESYKEQAVILGCTELPILYKKCKEAGYISSKRIFDPLQAAIDVICNEYAECDE